MHRYKTKIRLKFEVFNIEVFLISSFISLYPLYRFSYIVLYRLILVTLDILSNIDYGPHTTVLTLYALTGRIRPVLPKFQF